MCTASHIAREALWVHLGPTEGNNCDANLPGERMFAPRSGEHASQRPAFVCPENNF